MMGKSNFDWQGVHQAMAEYFQAARKRAHIGRDDERKDIATTNKKALK